MRLHRTVLPWLLLLAWRAHCFHGLKMLRDLAPFKQAVNLPSSLLSFGQERHLVAGLIQDEDVPQASQLLADSFPFEVSLSPADFKAWEVQLLSIPLGLINAYLRTFSFFEIYFGIKARMGTALQVPTLDPNGAAMMLGVADANTGLIVAVVELEMRVPDGTLPGNFPVPDFVKGQGDDVPRAPYLCNLAVSKDWRSQGIGKQLVRLSEHMVRNCWGGTCLYLHVDPSNDVAMGLYQSMGYKTAAPPEQVPAWLLSLLGVPEVVYLCKPLGNVAAVEQQQYAPVPKP